MTAAAAEQASSSSSSDSSSAGMKRARPSATTRPVLKRAAKGDTINDKMLFVGLRTKKRGREPHQLDDVVNSVPDATSMLVEQTQATGAREDGKGKRPILLPSSGVYGDDNEDYQRIVTGLLYPQASASAATPVGRGLAMQATCSLQAACQAAPAAVNQ
jgi:hypothetical protein